SFKTIALFQISSSNLPSIVGGLSNFGIVRGCVFSGGKTIADLAPPLVAGLVEVDGLALGTGAGCAIAVAAPRITTARMITTFFMRADGAKLPEARAGYSIDRHHERQRL